MQLDTALLIGLLFGTGIYLVLQRSFARILFGFLVLSNAANLFVLTMSGRPEGKGSPISGATGEMLVDPLPQALILTAIVIGFGVAAYIVFLLYRLFLEHNSANAHDLFDTQEEEE